jgi:mono/diheme cytochrome c family protein
MKNPFAGQVAAAEAGAKLYTRNCGSCHGRAGRGTGSVPALSKGVTQAAKDGEIFWYITKGDVDNGMPSWAGLPAQQRWQIVTYVKSLGNTNEKE